MYCTIPGHKSYSRRSGPLQARDSGKAGRWIGSNQQSQHPDLVDTATSQTLNYNVPHSMLSNDVPAVTTIMLSYSNRKPQMRQGSSACKRPWAFGTLLGFRQMGTPGDPGGLV